MPWLYYPINSGNTVSKDTNLPGIFKEGSSFNIKVAKYTLEGRLMELLDFNNSGLILCPLTEDTREFMFLLGRTYSHSVCFSLQL